MVRVGTSGWIYKHWRDEFYPRRLPQKSWFDYYAARFDTVEVNFSFYRLPTRHAFASWNSRAPREFCFAIKGSRYITHIKRLLDPEPHLKLLFDHAEPLSAHLGPVLWQLPPTFKRDDDRLEGFIAALPGDRRHTVEFRHPSWNEPAVRKILERHRVALCLADRRDRPASIELTADWTYLRFHQGRGRNGNYSERQLLQWAEQIDECRRSGVEVWAYFNNDQHGYAVDNALNLKRLLR